MGQSILVIYTSFIQQEYTRFINTLEAEHVTLPDIEEVEHKAKDIEKAATYVLSDKEVSEMIKRKQEVAGRTINASMEQAVLLSKLEHARSMQDDQMAQEIQRELDLLKEVVDSDKPRQTRNELPRVATEQSTQQVKVEREREREAQRHRNDMQQRMKRLKDMKYVLETLRRRMNAYFIYLGMVLLPWSIICHYIERLQKNWVFHFNACKIKKLVG